MQQPRTIACPSCGNINPYAADECIKCGLALEPIREALGKASGSPTVHAKAVAPAEMPPVPDRGPTARSASPVREVEAGPQETAPGAVRTRKEAPPELGYLWRFFMGWDLGFLTGGNLTLIRGMADRLKEVRRLFFERSEDRGISGASYSLDRLDVEGQIRDYQFAERDLGSSAKATIGVRIADIGSDLYVEWRHYALPPKEFFFGLFVLAGFIAFVASFTLFAILTQDGGVAFVIGAIVATVVGAWVGSQARGARLRGFQSQDSDAFQLAIRAAIDEALDIAHVSKELRIDTPYTSRLPEKKRLI